MPSARMSKEGEIGAGYAYFPPYYSFNLRFQLVDFLEVSGNYRVFKGVADPVLTQFGFGDFSDKGANVKLSLFSPEDSHYELPGLAIGLEDFLGTKAFKAYYIVLTQVFLKENLEISLGYGFHRIRKWFGGMNWMPFLHSRWEYLRNLSFTLEYDAIPYKDERIERHPKGHVKRTPWNIGIKYRLWDSIDLSVSYIRGDAVAFTASSYFDFGNTKGLIPKINDPLPYKAPVNTQAICELRPEDVFIQDLNYALREQGIDLMAAWISYEGECKCKTLRIEIFNMVYREERRLRERLNDLLAALTPDDIDHVIVTIDGIAVLIQEYHYDMRYIRQFREQVIGSYELATLTPLTEVSYPNLYTSKLIFKKKTDYFNVELMPKVHTLFGSSRGKFKYALGLSLAFNGFLYDNIYYSISLGYFAFSNLWDAQDVDRLNPSQIINVRSDLINYFKQKSITVDEAYIEKIWNWGKGWYTRLGFGLFEPEYGGVATEWLYYPVNSEWAVGMEFAVVKKRTPEGVNFTSRIRKLHGFHPTYRKFLGSQYFLNLYYDWKCTSLEFKFSAGKFLADDFGFKTQISRYFPSGLRVGFWYTYTNAKDIINGEIYHDKGVFFSMPLDIFYTHSSRSRWGYGMSAWLRDVGASAFTGTELYDLINQYRQ